MCNMKQHYYVIFILEEIGKYEKKYYDQLHSMHFIESTKKPSSSLQPAFRAHYYS